MNLEAFERKEAKRGGWKSVHEWRQFFDVTPCDCGKKKCSGWQVRYRFGTERRREAET